MGEVVFVTVNVKSFAVALHFKLKACVVVIVVTARMYNSDVTVVVNKGRFPNIFNVVVVSVPGKRNEYKHWFGAFYKLWFCSVGITEKTPDIFFSKLFFDTPFLASKSYT